jgi:hypothetical protein
MVTESLDTAPVENMQSSDNLGLLDVIDSSLGVSHYVSLPQIIVCGDQSSGKSPRHTLAADIIV